MEDTDKLGMQAFHVWHDWFRTQKLYSSNSDFIDNPIVWHPPSTGWVKCNIDAGFNNQHGTTNMDGA